MLREKLHGELGKTECHLLVSSPMWSWIMDHGSWWLSLVKIPDCSLEGELCLRHFSGNWEWEAAASSAGMNDICRICL